MQATAVQLRDILAEWERVGGTRVAGRDQLPDQLLTLRLSDLPEAGALDIVLRNVAGYIAVSRSPSAMAGGSVYSRVLVMATSKAPAGATSAPSNVRSGPVADVAAVLDTPAIADTYASTVAAAAAAESISFVVPPPALGVVPTHAPLPFVNDPDAPAAQGLTGRRADPGMVPVAVPSPGLPKKQKLRTARRGESAPAAPRAFR